MAFDPARDDWRTFRVDRMTELHLTGARFTAVDDPPDAAALVSQGVAVAAYDLQVSVRLPLPLDRARAMVPPPSGVVEAETATASSHRSASAATPTGSPATWPASTCPFEVLDGDEVQAELRALGRRLVREHR